MRIFTAFSALVLCTSAFAQTPGDCEHGTAEGDLNADGSEVFARVFNRGNLFFGNSTTAGNGYLVPRETANSPIFNATFWLGGKVNGQLRVAGARYTRYELWPGPLREGAVLPNPTDCAEYDRIFVVSRGDVARFLRTGQPTDDLRDWPVSWGAPVFDGDGIEGNYNLTSGDQPAIYGEQMAWWVMNDVGNIHEETGSNPLGVEVQASAFAVGSGIRALRQATYYRYLIVNRNDVAIDSAYVSLFADVDLGSAVDDWVGSDTTRSMGFVLNGDNHDAVYGIPPAQGYKVVQGPVGLPNGRDDDRDGVVDEQGERLRMTGFLNFPYIGGPYSCYDFLDRHTAYLSMRGVHCDGVPYTEGGNGYQTAGPITTFYYPGDPVDAECWSMANDCEGGFIPPNDRRLLVSSGPFRLEPGESTEVVFGLPFAQGQSQFDSLTKLRAAADIVQNAWDTGYLNPVPVEVEPESPDFPGSIELARPFPNPFVDRTTIRYELSESMAVRLAVYDVLGREVALLVEDEQEAGPHEVTFSGASLAPGTYVVRFEAAGEERTFSVVKLRP